MQNGSIFDTNQIRAWNVLGGKFQDSLHWTGLAKSISSETW